MLGPSFVPTNVKTTCELEDLSNGQRLEYLTASRKTTKAIAGARVSLGPARNGATVFRDPLVLARHSFLTVDVPAPAGELGENASKARLRRQVGVPEFPSAILFSGR